MNIGRFGHVEPGTPLVLTDQEYACVKADGDKRFVANKNPEQEAKSEAVQKENDPRNVAILEFKGKTRTQLLELAEQLSKEGKTFTLTKNPSKEELTRVLAPFVIPPEAAATDTPPSTGESK